MPRLSLVALCLIACSDPSSSATDLAGSPIEKDLAAVVDDDLAVEVDAAEPPDLSVSVDLAQPIDLGGPVGSVSLMAGGATTLTSVGATVQLSATAADFDGGTIDNAAIAWSSGTPAVATVDPTGKVTAVGNGTSVIHAIAGSNHAEATITITVTIPIASVTVAPSPAKVADSKTVALTATAKDAANAAIGNITFTWSSADGVHASVSTSGVVTGALSGSFGLGPITITASAGGQDGTAQVSIAVYKTWGFTTGAAGLTIDVDQNQYVILKNPDSATHSVVLDSDSSVVFSPFSKGDSAAAQITLPPGSHSFHCGIHGTAMTGTLVVH